MGLGWYTGHWKAKLETEEGKVHTLSVCFLRISLPKLCYRSGLFVCYKASWDLRVADWEYGVEAWQHRLDGVGWCMSIYLGHFLPIFDTGEQDIVGWLGGSLTNFLSRRFFSSETI